MLRYLTKYAFVLVIFLGGVQGSMPNPPDPRFGAVEAFWAPEQAAQAGLGWERILFYWREIQPTGAEDWNTLHVLEEWLVEADQQGREVVGVIKQTPAWATDGVENAGIPRGLYLPISHPQNLWANYTRKLAEYYAPRGVHHWIIWNEPDIEAGVNGYEFAGTPADYYQLLKVAYQTMKAADPQAIIHLAGTTYWHDALAGRTQYLQRLLEIAQNDPLASPNDHFFDVISLHIYFRSETIPAIVQEINHIQQQFGLNKPIWINETNAAPNQDPLWPVERPNFEVNLDQQAAFLVQAHTLGFAAGAERIGVYKFTDVLVGPGAEPFGLLRADLSPRPAYDAYVVMTQMLSGFETVTLHSTESYHHVAFVESDQIVHVLWARTREQVVGKVPATTTNATVVTLWGDSHLLSAYQGAYHLNLAGAQCAIECIIGGQPTYLVESLPNSPTTAPPPPFYTPLSLKNGLAILLLLQAIPLALYLYFRHQTNKP